MKILTPLIFLFFQLSSIAQAMRAEDYFISAYNGISSMLSGRGSLSIKRAVYLSEWAYLEGDLNYYTDFCDEINRIVKFVNLFYDVNKLSSYKTGKQISLNEYFFRPYSGNHYLPYTYDFENFSIDNEPWECQFVSKVLKTHKGQCRSLPWLYKILATEMGIEVFLAHAPRHCYIIYKDEDNFTPKEWINLELTTHQMHPAQWIKQSFDICDSAIIVGTYMTPLNDVETIASQLADLAFGYHEKFRRYDEFTYYCALKSLEYYPQNPNAVIIMGKSLDALLQNHLNANGGYVDEYANYLSNLIRITQCSLEHLYMTVETPEIKEHRRESAVDAIKYIKENLIPKL